MCAAYRPWRMPILLLLGCAVIPRPSLADTPHVQQVPNGPAFSCSLCHDAYPPEEAPFGLDVAATMKGEDVDWSQLWAIDSDGDGFTNGQELGDPDGLWGIGDPHPGGVPSHPGQKDSYPIVCGDGVKVPEEACDFGDAEPGDGCGVDCTVEPGWACDSGGCDTLCATLEEGSEHCDDGNPCTLGICTPGKGCSAENLAAGCDDGDACTSGETCGDGVCGGGDVVSCGDDNPCTDDSCDPSLGCVNEANAAPCDDGSACTKADYCFDSLCFGGGPVSCVDGNPCTDDVCKSSTGCHNPPKAGAPPCDDGDLCTAGEACSEGVCVAGTPIVCQDDEVCTTDACDPDSGCVFPPASGLCDDGKICTTDDFCVGGGCEGGSALYCDDGNPCTADACDPASGCVNVPQAAECSDGDECTTPDQCVGGTCVPGAEVVCEDGEPCTADVCDGTLGCTFSPADGSCDDGNPCTVDDVCAQGACAPGSALDCDDGDECTLDVCAAAEGCTHTPIEEAPCVDVTDSTDATDATDATDGTDGPGTDGPGTDGPGTDGPRGTEGRDGTEFDGTEFDGSEGFDGTDRTPPGTRDPVITLPPAADDDSDEGSGCRAGPAPRGGSGAWSIVLAGLLLLLVRRRRPRSGPAPRPAR